MFEHVAMVTGWVGFTYMSWQYYCARLAVEISVAELADYKLGLEVSKLHMGSGAKREPSH